MRWPVRGGARQAWLTLAALAVAVALPSLPVGQSAATEPLALEVTNPADMAPAPVCPDASRCTLRKAIEVTNADTSGAPVRITFSPAVFPAAQPAAVDVSAQPLPVVTRDDVTIDAAGRGVVIAGAAQSVTPSLNGLVFAGARATVRGLAIRGFVGACLHFTGASAVAGGDRAAGAGNKLDGCGVGIRADAADAAIYGNDIGFASPEPGAASVGAGIWVMGPNSSIGTTLLGGGFANRVGNAETAIRIGGFGTTPVSGLRVAYNEIGGGVNEPAAPVQVGVSVLVPTVGAAVTGNSIANAGTGISIQGSNAGPSASRITIQANVFQAISRLAIDLNGDGLRNPNDAGDADTGANGLLNSPVFSRAVQARVTGTACPGCQVQLYIAQHSPGGMDDYGARPVAAGVATADAGGTFAFAAPAVSPGEWLVALATDADGNTSEFSSSTRVGSGSVQCGNASLQTGWNLVGYFGSEPINLGASFPPDGPAVGAVRAIYRLDAANAAYSRWLADTGAGRTLASLEPGEAYWMLADSPATLPGGFSLSAPVPVDLRAGWNTIVYIGATAAVADALQSIAGKYTQLLAWSPENQTWSRFGTPDVPPWARDFTGIQACGAYEIFMAADALLAPLQP